MLLRVRCLTCSALISAETNCYFALPFLSTFLNFCTVVCVHCVLESGTIVFVKEKYMDNPKKIKTAIQLQNITKKFTES